MNVVIVLCLDTDMWFDFDTLEPVIFIGIDYRKRKSLTKPEVCELKNAFYVIFYRLQYLKCRKVHLSAHRKAI